MAARILIIEDNETNLALMVYLLKSFGYEALTAGDGEEGVRKAKAGAPDLIICDLEMPKMNGFEVARQLKADSALREIPLLGVTALAMVGDREKVLASGFDGYISKPIDPEQFVAQAELYLREEQRSMARPGDTAALALNYQAVATIRANVLAVDNTAVNLKLLRDLLEPLGYRVCTASDMGEGMALAQRHAFDLIFSDVRMPNGSGFELLRWVKSQESLRSVPFVFLCSSHLTTEEKQEALALGAAKVIVRPVDPPALVAEIEAILDTNAELHHGKNLGGG